MLLCCTHKAMGQDSLYRCHDVSVSLGVLSIPFNAYGYGPSLFSFSAQYGYQLSKLVGLGMIANYSPVSKSDWEYYQYVDNFGISHYEETRNSKIVGDYLTIMPAVRLCWVNKRSFTLYSKLAVGISYDTYKNKTSFAGQWSPLGITFGRRLYGIFEYGTGRQGLLIFGMGYKFRPQSKQ